MILVLAGGQVELLRKSMSNYRYPSKLFDFESDTELPFAAMRELEEYLNEKLLSGDQTQVKYALANIVYWGNIRAGYCMHRVKEFRDRVTELKLKKTIALLPTIHHNGLKRLQKLKLPQFSQLTFLSKLRMFLDPKRYVTLDLKLLKLRESPIQTLLRNVKVYGTYIPVNAGNCIQYEKWSSLCRDTLVRYFPNENFIAVDVERGIFGLVDKHKITRKALDEAASIVHDMSASNGVSSFDDAGQ